MNILSRCKKFITEKRGNVAMVFGIAMLPLMLSVAATIDYSRASRLHGRVAQATDAALLAAVATVMKEVDLSDTAKVIEKLSEEFEPFLLANLRNVPSLEYHGYSLNYNSATRQVSAEVQVDYETAVFGIVGVESWKADVKSTAKMQMRAGGAVSLFLVLDRSGSMGWSNGEGGTKIDSLQSAVGDMISNLESADPAQKFIRMGAVAYSSYRWSVEQISWNLSNSNDYVQAMYAGGGTDSSNAVKKAYRKLKKSIEITEHMNKSGQDPDLVMIFMTDGDNNSSSDDVSTINTCRAAKSYGMEIYTVAFQAPSKGQQLLRNCANDGAHYFEADDTGDLIEAFQDIGAKVAELLILSQ